MRYGRSPPKKMEKPRKELTPLGDIISSLLNDGVLPFNPDDVDIWKVWGEVVGEPFSENTRPARISNRRLRVAVFDSISLQELQFRESDIRAKLNEKLGRPAVDKIEFRAGSR